MSFYFRTTSTAQALPTEHQGEHDDWRPGATCEDCQIDYITNRVRVYHTPFWGGVIEGGAKDNEETRMHLDFDSDMYAYEDARNEGLRPYSTTKAGVKRATDEVTSHTKALKAADKVGIEFGPDTKVAPGVDTDLLVH